MAQILDFFGTPLVIGPSSGQLSGNAGLLPVRQLDQRIGLARAFAEALDDPRGPDLTEHSFLYPFRLNANAVLQRKRSGLLAEAVASYERQR